MLMCEAWQNNKILCLVLDTMDFPTGNTFWYEFSLFFAMPPRKPGHGVLHSAPA